MNDSAVDPRIRQFITEQRDIIIDRYSNKGGFGELYFGKRIILGDRVALKFYNLNDGSGHEEAQLLKKISHENILPILDARIIDKDISFYLTPEMSGGDLQNIIDKFIVPTDISIEIIVNVLKALTELHKDGNRMVHRDLKTGNVLVDLNDGVKTYLADFGTIRKIPKEDNFVNASTYSFLYRPYEALIENKYYIESDIYQVGIILYQVLGGKFPMNTPIEWLTARELKKYNQLPTDLEKSDYLRFCLNNLIVKCKILDLNSLPVYIPTRLKTIIKKATSVDYNKRYKSTSEFIKALFDYQKIAKIWWIESDVIYAKCPKKKVFYRILKSDPNYILQQSKDKTNWRKKAEGKLKRMIEEIE